MGGRQAQLSCVILIQEQAKIYLKILHVCTILEQVLKNLLQPAFLLLKLKKTGFFVFFGGGGVLSTSFSFSFY